ncbi:Hypothetical predicted protein [Pelobates cultripes]|uniref:Uncharacterized protein n=1 Tax=Pelobates cultripes TaxID=61616 RepID=A0AAD1WMM8_PELCU|nr:Hypothetical predicted protein [Pelobates cultripes]
MGRSLAFAVNGCVFPRLRAQASNIGLFITKIHLNSRKYCDPARPGPIGNSILGYTDSLEELSPEKEDNPQPSRPKATAGHTVAAIRSDFACLTGRLQAVEQTTSDHTPQLTTLDKSSQEVQHTLETQERRIIFIQDITVAKAALRTLGLPRDLPPGALPAVPSHNWNPDRINPFTLRHPTVDPYIAAMT